MEESLIESVLDGVRGFFDLTEDEKQQFEGKHVLDPIRCGTSFNVSVEKCFFWRDYLKVFVHPEFHFPHIPSGFRYIFKINLCQFCKEFSNRKFFIEKVCRL